ncbi:unnamed protein product [Caenorhabditis sp. 36 PRJEB53466]|nr:unnamed protein product [Caenorhabditis sp. 36 PRJEB53466]
MTSATITSAFSTSATIIKRTKNRPPGLLVGRDRFIYGPERLRNMKNPDPETSEDDYVEHDVHFWVTKGGKFLIRKFNDTKRVFVVCTEGFEAKVINVVGYSILQIVLDLTALQLMILHEEIEYTRQNLAIITTLFFATLFGAIVAVYRCAFGTALLMMTQIVITIGVLTHYSLPMIFMTIIEFWEENKIHPIQLNVMKGMQNLVGTVFNLIFYAAPTILGTWFIYCTIMVTFVLLGVNGWESLCDNTLAIQPDLQRIVPGQRKPQILRAVAFPGPESSNSVENTSRQTQPIFELHE